MAISDQRVKPKDLDHIYVDIIGGAGTWQWRTTFLLLVVWWCAYYPLYTYIFAAYVPPHRCFIEGCDSANSTMNESFLSFTTARGNFSSLAEILWPTLTFPDEEFLVHFLFLLTSCCSLQLGFLFS